MQNTGFLDLLFNLLLGFVILTIVSFMMIRPLTKTADAKNKAEYVISVNWPNENKDDIDTWLEDPTGKTVWFGQKEANLMHLDRDDLGNVNDFVTLADGSFAICPRNQELTTIRGFIPGEWILNIHAYSKRESKPTPVDVTIDRINPSLKTVFYKQIVMENQWQEETATRFTMLGNGDIINLDQTFKNLVKSKKRNNVP